MNRVKFSLHKQKPAIAENLQGRTEIVIIIALIAFLQSCSFTKSTPVVTAILTPTLTNTITQIIDKPVSTTPSTTTTITPEPVVSTSLENQEYEGTNVGYIQQGAGYGYLDPLGFDEIATGTYQAHLPECGNSWLNSFNEENDEITLTLDYATPVMAEQLELYTSKLPSGINRVELFNANTGLAKILEGSDINFEEHSLTEGACSNKLVLPVKTDFEVDRVIIEFDELSSVAQIASVELSGRLYAFTEPSVFWRVPLPGTPVDIALGHNGLVYVITEPNNLFTYDVEGNQLNKFSIPNEAKLTAIETDQFGNLILSESTNKQFIILSPDGEQLTSGGDVSFGQVSVNPLDGNLYLLGDNAIDVFTTDTAEFVRRIEFNDQHLYTKLAFNSQGHLFILRDYSWDATLLEIDSYTGEELNAIPLVSSTVNEILARDFDIDESGTINVLFFINTGQIAIHQFDQQGILQNRFGLLTSEPDDWPEGSFLDPCAITVSQDGRFVLVADGYEEQSYLTAFMMEIDE